MELVLPMMISLVLLSISAVSITVFSLVPIYMRLLRHTPALLRMFQGVTSGLSITMMILCVWLQLTKMPCQAILALVLYFMTSSLAWLILDNMDVALTLTTKYVTSWRYRLVFLTIGWGSGFIPVVLVLSILSYDMGQKDIMCWFGEKSHWTMAGVLLISALVELVTINLAMFILLSKRKNDLDVRLLKEKRRRLLTNAVTFTSWITANCIGCLSMTPGHENLLYAYGALLIIYALLHGGLFVLGEYKIKERLSLVYRLLKLEPVPSAPHGVSSNPQLPETSQQSRQLQPSPREVCRVPPLSKEGPKLGAVYRRKETESPCGDKF